MKISLVIYSDWTTISAFDKNFKAKANSSKPRITFTEFNQPPDLGNCFKPLGNIANKVKGKAKATPNPNIPINGPLTPPSTAASIIKEPITGPVHENETKASVNAMKKTPKSPPLSAFESILLIHEAGKLISNAPKKLTANIANIKKKAILKEILLAIKYIASSLTNELTPKPKATYITIIEIPYMSAWRIPFDLDSAIFVKYVTVIGIIGKTHGVNNAKRPAPKPTTNNHKILSVLICPTSIGTDNL